MNKSAEQNRIVELLSGIWEFMIANQTLSVGFLAFFGVAITVLAGNYRLTRTFQHSIRVENDRHERELDHRRVSVRDAISAELSLISQFLLAEYEQARSAVEPDWKTEASMSRLDMGPKGYPYPFTLPDRDVVYRNLVGQLPSLRHREILAIIEAHDIFQRFRSWIAEHGLAVSGASNRFHFREDQMSDLIAAIEEARWPINNAVGRLSE